MKRKKEKGDRSDMKKLVSFFGEESEIFRALNERAKTYAEQFGIQYRWIPQNPYDIKKVITELKEADAGIIDIEPYGENIFSQIGNRTKLLIRFGVGYDQVDLRAASRHGIAVARTTAANTTAVAEMALLLMIAARRRFPEYERCVEKGEWKKKVGHEVIGSAVGIVGFGRIGQYLARLLKGFGCRLMVYDPFLKESALHQYGAESVTLEEMFRTADVVSIHTPYCQETHNMIDERLLGMMKREAVLVNTARGNIVDEEALFYALKEKKLAAAAFDVFATEPLPKDSPLRSLPNMVITPHASSQTVESLWNIYKTAIEIASDFFAGRKTEHILNVEKLGL